MIIKQLLIVTAIVLFANTTFAQSGRLVDLSSRLASQASEFADSSYRSYSGAFRNNRSDIEAVMLAQQFSSVAQLFYRMNSDRRRNQELREAFQLLQELGRSLDRTNLQRDRWSDIQRLISDISRELNYDYPNDNNDQYPSPGPSRSGRMTWKGRVDQEVRILIRGGRADVETLEGTPYYDSSTNFTASLPRRANVRLKVKKGRGEAFLEQQPSRENDFTAIVHIRDPKGGASSYEFELSW
ncbi:MAG TPA: hypothetical protein VJ124_14815 [Pyrinomonadaceae bacterium]|nr:hypothetical protein [Pyrinomonadaceae bacterium]